jgi:hypothetical protein
MNPFFEQCWRDTHASLITYTGDALQERLPADLIARTEEEVVVIGAGGSPTTFRPDAQIQKPWTLHEPSLADPGTNLPPSAGAEPSRVFMDDEVEKWIEIREITGRLITVLELLSPEQQTRAGRTGALSP